MQCDDLAQDLPGFVDGSVRFGRNQRRHVERCLRCQADLANYRKVLRSLHLLRHEMIEPGPGLLTDILASLDGASIANGHAIRTLLSGRRVAYLGGLAAATAAGAVSAVVFTTRARRARLAG